MADTKTNRSALPFLPARESAVFIRLFEWYCNWLTWRRFDSVSICSRYKPEPGQKTIYYLNHNSWWDGLVPFLLNQKKFRQNARGMMEDKQLHRYPFFQKIGVFSINLSSPRASMQSMRYALESMKRPGAALYIYPQGKIKPFRTTHLEFRKGLGWLTKKLPEADIVPVAIHIHTRESDKPRLEILAGNAVTVDRDSPTQQITEKLEADLSTLLQRLVNR